MVSSTAEKLALFVGELPADARRLWIHSNPLGEVAQLVEHTAENRGVAGSTLPAVMRHLELPVADRQRPPGRRRRSGLRSATRPWRGSRRRRSPADALLPPFLGRIAEIPTSLPQQSPKEMRPFGPAECTEGGTRQAHGGRGDCDGYRFGCHAGSEWKRSASSVSCVA